jgi:aryl-alcohol dehydrogenase-like predicted oxidoreductase
MPLANISHIGFGCWQIGGSNIVSGKNIGWSSLDDIAAIALLTEAYEKGISFFDTADSYGSGKSESLIGEALSGEPFTICTKFGWVQTEKGNIQDFSPSRVIPALEMSLQRLRKNKVTHFLLHNPNVKDITPELIEALYQAKAAGLAENIGLSVTFIEPYMEHIDSFDTFEILHNIITTQNEPYFNGLSSKHVFIRSIFASGLLLMNEDKLRGGTQFSDWRTDLPPILFQKAAAFAKQTPENSRYSNILEYSVKLPVSKILIGMSKPITFKDTFGLPYLLAVIVFVPFHKFFYTLFYACLWSVTGNFY